MCGHFQHQQLVKPDQQQGMQVTVLFLQWLAQQLCQQRFKTITPAQGSKRQLLGQCPLTRVIQRGELWSQQAAQGFAPIKHPVHQ